MCWYEMTIKPRDILFFRDAKPMEASSVGSGANWPLPNTLHDALFHALREKWPEKQDWEFTHKHANRKDNRETRDFEDLRFGGLKTFGLFPSRDGEIWLPCPSDVDAEGNPMQRVPKPAHTNLPDWIDQVILPVGKPSKKDRPKWIPARQWIDYANGNSIVFDDKAKPLFHAEHRPGIAIDPETGSVDTGNDEEGGKFYLAEYLRLADDVSLRGFASCESSLRGEKTTDVLQSFFEQGNTQTMVFGGQRGVVQLNGTRTEKPLSMLVLDKKPDELLVKWVLLSPSIFIGGWLPGWIDRETGKVRLKAERPERQPGQSREAWRESLKHVPEIDAKLIAASIEKPIPFSGWNNRIGGPRPTMLAVPAGSVYWFRATTGKDADALIKTLQGRCKSDFYGEKGFGLGICL